MSKEYVKLCKICTSIFLVEVLVARHAFKDRIGLGKISITGKPKVLVTTVYIGTISVILGMCAFKVKSRRFCSLWFAIHNISYDFRMFQRINIALVRISNLLS